MRARHNLLSAPRFWCSDCWHLLAASRFNPPAVDVNALVTGMAELMSSTTGPQIKVLIDVAEGLPPAKADPNQLEMALLNLTVNARDAMPEGGTLRINAVEEMVVAGHPAQLEPGRYVRLSVKDTGTGMDAQRWPERSSRSSPPRALGKGPALAFLWCTVLPCSLAVLFPFRAGKELAAIWSCGCLQAAHRRRARKPLTGMSGTDLAHLVRAELPGIKVLVVSGYAETAGIAPDLPRLSKPFRQADLAAIIAAEASVLDDDRAQIS